MGQTLVQPQKIRYLVLEPQGPTSLLKGLYEHSDNPSWLYLFSDTDWHAYAEYGPILLAARQDSTEYRWALNELKQGSVSGLILESSGGLDEVVEWLRAQLNVRFDGIRHGLLRFYDPLIWHQLASKTKSAKAVIERVMYWHGEPGHERWMTAENPEPLAAAPVPTLEERQWTAVSAIRG